MWVKKQQLEPYMEQLTGSKLEMDTTGCVLSPCLFKCMQSTSWRKEWQPIPVFLPGEPP